MNPFGDLGVRHLQCFFLFTATMVAYAMRVNLYIAILAMTDKKYTNQDQPEYNWNEQTKSIVLSSFFWGYCVTQIPAGHLAVMFGGKVVLSSGILTCSIMTMITPICANFGDWKLVCALCVIEGLSQGVIFPSFYAILSNWSPIEERGVLGSIGFSGIQVGIFVTTIISGYISASSLGWPFVFYISGVCGVLWTICFCLWGANSPSECKFISVDEKTFINASIALFSSDAKSRESLKTPWSRICSSVPFIAATFAQCSNEWGLVTLIQQVPAYFKNILGLNITTNATLAALPWLTMLVCCIMFGSAATAIEIHCNVKTWTLRRICSTIGEWIPSLALLGVGFLGKEHTILAVALVTVAIGCNAGVFVSVTLSHMDLSPNFAATLMGIANTCSNVLGFLAPLFVGVFVTDEKNPEQWRIVFFFASGYYFLGNLVYIIFGSADVQHWNDSRKPLNSQE